MSDYFDRTADKGYTRVYKNETPDILAAFAAFDQAVFATEGREIPLKYGELIALGSPPMRVRTSTRTCTGTGTERSRSWRPRHPIRHPPPPGARRATSRRRPSNSSAR